MIRLSISVALAFAVATSAEAMPLVPLHEPDATITQVRKARQCEDPNQVVVNGICEFDARSVPHRSTSAWHGMTAFALSTMGRSRGGGLAKSQQRARCRPTTVKIPCKLHFRLGGEPSRKSVLEGITLARKQ